MKIINPRVVPLGESDGLTVRRTVPSRELNLIGGWCFIDHFGPDDVSHGGMQVAPHPHTGLQTVSWLFSGEIEHRDSAGHHAFIRPGELNLMTAGRGISHSEVSTTSSDEVHGVQLWIALPDEYRNVAPTFEHYIPTKQSILGVSVTVFIGELLGFQSPATTYSDLVGAEITLSAGKTLDVELTSEFEYGFLVDQGSLVIDQEEVDESHLAYTPPGSTTVTLQALKDTRLILLGGKPLGESIVMWWNFIGRTHDEIVEYRNQWESEIAGASAHKVFGHPFEDPQLPMSAPAIPGGRIKSRS